MAVHLSLLKSTVNNHLYSEHCHAALVMIHDATFRAMLLGNNMTSLQCSYWLTVTGSLLMIEDLKTKKMFTQYQGRAQTTTLPSIITHRLPLLAHHDI